MRRRFSSRRKANSQFTIRDLLLEHSIYLLVLVSFWVWGARPIILFSANLTPEYIAIRFSSYFETIDRVVKFAQGGFSPNTTEIAANRSQPTPMPTQLPPDAANQPAGNDAAPVIPTVTPTLPLPPPVVATSLAIIQPDTPTPRSIDQTNNQAPPATRPPTATPSPADPGVAHLMFVGDIMLDRALGNAIESGFVNFPFAEVNAVLSAADLTVGNFESSIGSIGEPNPRKSYAFQSPPQSGSALMSAGFDLVSLANNHALDYGGEALLQGIDIFNEVGIETVGAGHNSESARRPVILERNGLRFAFLAYANVPIEGIGFDTSSWEARTSTPGLAWGRIEDITTDIEQIKASVDHVIVLLHSGIEYQYQPSPTQVQLSRGAIDAGASLVIGHHSHILQGTEQYNGGLIAYGLGNFAFDIDGDPSSTIMEVWVDADGILSYKFIPVIITFGGQPRLASPEEGASILQQIERGAN